MAGAGCLRAKLELELCAYGVSPIVLLVCKTMSRCTDMESVNRAQTCATIIITNYMRLITVMTKTRGGQVVRPEIFALSSFWEPRSRRGILRNSVRSPDNGQAS